MLSIEEHVEKASRNEAFARWLLSQDVDHYDWVLVAGFYSAVHFVESALLAKKAPSHDHATRDGSIARLLRDCYKPYRRLKDLSIEARYNRVTIPKGNFNLDVVNDLEAIKRGTRFARRA
ncbi:MAG TPA: hypothetical protein VJ826_00745 [Candidatus Polarisedimenticolaceae bacterium]|nr:hypothetical protein [Candidatus Polarisedimenticolaceae bacterium]